MIQAAASVGRVSTVEILSEIKSNLERSSHPEAESSSIKSWTFSKAVHREKQKILGHSSTIPETEEEIRENLSDKIAVTTSGGVFLQYWDYMNDQKQKLLMLFMSDHGGWVLGQSKDIFVDGTFDTAPEPFTQIYFIMGQMGQEKQAIPCEYTLLPDRETSSYTKVWSIISSFIKFEVDLPQMIMSGFEKGVMNTLSKVFPSEHSFQDVPQLTGV
jgi:hypothetical protein